MTSPTNPTPALWKQATQQRRPRLDGGDADTIVVGGGLSGLCTALLLARAGQDIIVLEALEVGALASGRNTGKVSLLQGTKLSRLLEQHTEAVAASYVEANREGAAWLRRFCEEHGVVFQSRDAFTYAATPTEIYAATDELDAARRLGLPVTWSTELDLPFATHGAVTLADQFQLDPQEVVLALAEQVEQHSGRIGETQRVVDVSWGRRPRVVTADGAHFGCRNLVLATGAPILDRGLYFAKLEAHRSYLLAFTGARPPPGMMLSAGQHARSLREGPGDPTIGESALLVGGNDHVVGRGRPELAGVESLRSWVSEYYPDAVETHAWSAQDYRSHDGIPYVGMLPRGFGRIWVASGYDKWGLANAISAGLRIAGAVLGYTPEWARPLERRITAPSAAAELVRRNATTAAVAATRLARAEARTVNPVLPRRTGEVGRDGLDPRPVGVVGTGCAVRAVCTHLGGTLRWNDAERSWDCPLHGSRFAADGEVLEGPAVRPLERIEQRRTVA